MDAFQWMLVRRGALKLAALAALLASCGTTTPGRADGFAPNGWNELGRKFGVGTGPGYHAQPCRQRPAAHFQHVTGQLPAPSATVLPRLPAAPVPCPSGNCGCDTQHLPGAAPHAQFTNPAVNQPHSWGPPQDDVEQVPDWMRRDTQLNIPPHPAENEPAESEPARSEPAKSAPNEPSVRPHTALPPQQTVQKPQVDTPALTDDNSSLSPSDTLQSGETPTRTVEPLPPPPMSNEGDSPAAPPRNGPEEETDADDAADDLLDSDDDLLGNESPAGLLRLGSTRASSDTTQVKRLPHAAAPRDVRRLPGVVRPLPSPDRETSPPRLATSVHTRPATTISPGAPYPFSASPPGTQPASQREPVPTPGPAFTTPSQQAATQSFWW